MYLCIFVEIPFETVVKVKSSRYFCFCPYMKVSELHQTSREWHIANQKLGGMNFTNCTMCTKQIGVVKILGGTVKWLDVPCIITTKSFKCKHDFL